MELYEMFEDNCIYGVLVPDINTMIANGKNIKDINEKFKNKEMASDELTIRCSIMANDLVNIFNTDRTEEIFFKMNAKVAIASIFKYMHYENLYTFDDFHNVVKNIIVTRKKEVEFTNSLAHFNKFQGNTLDSIMAYVEIILNRCEAECQKTAGV